MSRLKRETGADAAIITVSYGANGVVGIGYHGVSVMRSYPPMIMRPAPVARFANSCPVSAVTAGARDERSL